MNDLIISLLQSDNPQERKRGINAAAKSADPRYLKHLAALVKTEPVPELRDLAKRAGSYIHKQSQQQSATAPATPKAQAPSQPEPPASPSNNKAPSSSDMATIAQSVAGMGAANGDPEQAEHHYDMAFELHLKDDNARASLELATAFFMNPSRYTQDPTAVAFAAEMTGKPPTEAIPYILDRNNWRELTDRHGGFQKQEGAEREMSDAQTLILWVLGGVLVIALLGIVFSFMGSDTFAALVQGMLYEISGGRAGQMPVPANGIPLPTPTLLP